MSQIEKIENRYIRSMIHHVAVDMGVVLDAAAIEALRKGARKHMAEMFRQSDDVARLGPCPQQLRRRDMQLARRIRGDPK